MEIGIYVDVSNIYYCINKKYKGKKLNYQKYMEYVEELGGVLVANAYGAQVKNEASTFLHSITKIGFTPKYKRPKMYYNGTSSLKLKADWDVGITVDIIRDAGKLDMVILGSADGDFVPLVEWLKEKKIKTCVLACNISSDLFQAADISIEIPISMIGG